MSRTLPISSHHKSPPPDPSPPVSLFIWHTTTTGPSPTEHAITSIAAIQFTLSTQHPPTFSTLIQPSDPTHAFRNLTAFITHNTPPAHTPLLIAHNAAFHAAFLRAALDDARIPTPDWLFADSLPLFRRVFPQTSATNTSYSIPNLAARFDLPLNHNNTHTTDPLSNLHVLRHLLILANTRLTTRADPLHHTLRPDAESLQHLADRFVHQTSPSDTHSSLPYITTRNGRFVHMQEHCRNLRSAKELIRVDLPDPSLARCYICCDDNLPIATPDKNELPATTPSEHSSSSDTTDAYLSAFSDHERHRPIKEENSVSPPFANTTADTSVPSTANQTYITTRSGRFYHIDSECRNLRRAKLLIPVTELPTHLTACYLCCTRAEQVGENDHEHGATLAPSTPVSTSSAPRKPRRVDWDTPKSSSQPVTHDSRTQQVHNTTYITTKYGKFYHMDRKCHNLRSAKQLIPVDKPPQHLTACYRCCLNPHLEDDDLQSVPIMNEQFEDCLPCFPPTRVDSNKPAVPEP